MHEPVVLCTGSLLASGCLNLGRLFQPPKMRFKSCKPVSGLPLRSLECAACAQNFQAAGAYMLG